ncbi:MAG: relaxase domain-containing protein [Acidimicrobiales bacterium]|nr:relaxase domain-containing protein [Acidimicrobiales bacterium]
MVVVVMRVTTLKATSDKLPGLLAYYAGLAEDRERPGLGRGPVDYYLDPDEPPGRWWGRGQAGLDLDGAVTGEQLRAVLDGSHPSTGRQLGRRFGDSSARGFDATFSAPKSVSVLWALTPDPWVRAEVLAAHDAAVDAALAWFERHGAVTRRGRDGVFQVDTLGVTAALFRQHTSRAMDPQLHTHAILAAKVQDPSVRWLSLDARFLKYQQRSIGAVYDAALRTELTSRLGATWVDPGAGVFDLACVPEAVREGFSKRTGQVEARLAQLVRRWSDDHDGLPPSPRTIARLERDAAEQSRPDKTHPADARELHAEWAAEARAAGFDPSALVPERIAGRRPPMGSITDEELVDEALLRIAEESSSWLRADLARHLATVVDAGPTAEEVVVDIDRLASLAEARCVALGPEPDTAAPRRTDGRPVTEHITDRRLTTPSVLHEEKDLQSWATASIGQTATSGDRQIPAAAAMAGDDCLVLVVGPAGAGKTTATAQAVASMSARGRPVVGLAPSGKAADVLAREADCVTNTVAGFLTRHRDKPSPWRAGTTVVLDEAGMTGTADLAQLVSLVREHRWRLVAIGDPAQLPSVARGGVFARWCDTLPTHTLDEPRRFTEPWEAAASLGLRSGDPDAVDAYAAHDRVHTTHPALVASQVARVHQRAEGDGRSVAITVGNAETARAINREIQWLRKSRGPGADLHDGTRAHVGDQVATRRNDANLRCGSGAKVRNRQIWTVTAVGPDGRLTVTDPRRGTVDLPPSYVAAHVELGWAVTGYGSQGDTVDVGIAVLDVTTSRNHAYVAMTRGRHANDALLVDPTGIEDPADLFARITARAANGESALAVQDRLHRAAGCEVPGGAGERHEPTIEEQVERIHKRLDQIQRRPTPPPDHSLGR